MQRIRCSEENAFVESFNGRMRDELLNETLFMSMGHAREKVTAWADDYYAERPHSSLECPTPAAFAADLTNATGEVGATGADQAALPHSNERCRKAGDRDRA